MLIFSFRREKKTQYMSSV